MINQESYHLQIPKQVTNHEDNNSNSYLGIPYLEVHRPIKPSKFYAIPLVGALIKIFLLSPILVIYLLYSCLVFFIAVINSLIIFITGKFWSFAYIIFSNFLHFQAELYFYFSGITNQYPLFHKDKSSVELSYQYPSRPSRLFAIPVLGFFVRFVLVLPHMLYTSIILYGTTVIYFIAWVPILLTNSYPDRFYELWRDGTRLALNDIMYLIGMTDIYPSYSVSLNYPFTKIACILIGLFLALIQSSLTTSHAITTAKTNLRSSSVINQSYK